MTDQDQEARKIVRELAAIAPEDTFGDCVFCEELTLFEYRDETDHLSSCLYCRAVEWVERWEG